MLAHTIGSRVDGCSRSSGTPAAPTCCSPRACRRRSGSTATCTRSTGHRRSPPTTPTRCSPSSSPRRSRRPGTAGTSTTSPSAGATQARIRGNAFSQRGYTAVALRMIPRAIPTMAELGLPPILGELSQPAPGPGPRHRPDRVGQVDHAGGDDRPDQHRPAPATSSPSRTRSSTCTSTSARRSTSARSAPTPPRSPTRCARRCARTPTSCWSARCATWSRSGSR